MSSRDSAVTDERLTDADRFVLSRSISSAELFSTTEWVASIPEPGQISRFVEWSGGGIRVELQTQEPPRWLLPTLRSLDELMTLPPNWDSYGAQPIRRRNAIEALSLLAEVSCVSTPAPSVVPLPDGGIQLEWHSGGVDLEVSLPGSGPGHVSWEDRAGSSWEAELPAGRARLCFAIDELSR